MNVTLWDGTHRTIRRVLATFQAAGPGSRRDPKAEALGFGLWGLQPRVEMATSQKALSFYWFTWHMAGIAASARGGSRSGDETASV